LYIKDVLGFDVRKRLIHRMVLPREKQKSRAMQEDQEGSNGEKEEQGYISR